MLTVPSGGSSTLFGDERSSSGCSVSMPGLDSLMASGTVPIAGDLSGLSVLRRMDGCFDLGSEYGENIFSL